MLCVRFKLLIFFFMMLWAFSAFAKKNIEGLRIWTSPDGVRVIFDLSDKVKYKVFTLENPDRVVLDIAEVEYHVGALPELQNSNIVSIRHSQNTKEGVRIVLDLKNKAKATSFLLSPNDSYGNRLVVDLSTAIFPKTKTIKETATRETKTQDYRREFIVAIDPGHGGDDSGAVGKFSRLKEKEVVLAVSRKLEILINAQPGMRAFLVRSGDYYVGLRKRMTLARKQGADLFISVHADSFKDTRASGASVFILSEKGASNEAARWLAEKENRSDLIGGVSLEDKGSLLASVLLDLSQTACQSASHELGSHLIGSLAKVSDLHHKTVQHAGFMVLKSPDVPSVLVELGFISNKQGEQNLQNEEYQQSLANALLGGIKAYIAKRPPPIHHPQNWDIAKNN